MPFVLTFVLALGAVPASSMSQAAASPAPSPSPSAATPLPTARPSVIATPRATQGLVLPAVPAVEPSFSAPQQALPSGDIAGAQGPFVGLALDTAVAMALAHNTDLAVAQANRRVAAFDIVAAQGAYDVRFVVQPQYKVSQTAPLSAFNAGPGGTPVTNVTAGATAGFQGATGSGGTFSLSTTAERINDNNTLNSYDPYYQTALALQLTQPLLRGRTIDQTRRQIQISRINAALSSAGALVQASTTVDNVLNAYYNLVAAWKNVAIQEDALRQAKAQSESNARLVRQGAAARVDVIESDTQVNEFQDDVFSAIADVASLQNTLKGLLLGDPSDPLWTANLVPTSPVTNLVAEPSVDSVVVAALKNRPEVTQLRENIRAENVNVEYARDQTRPQLDLNLGVTENGFAGAPTSPGANPFNAVLGADAAAINQLIARVNALGGPPLLPVSTLAVPLFPGTVGKIGQSYGSALQGKYPEYALSATIGLPLRNRVARSAYSAELERRRSLQTQELGLIQRLQVEARNAVQGYRSARSRLVAAGAARASAEQVAASELRRFRAGASTTFLVLQRQVAVANQRNRELRAQTDVQRAVVELDRVSGNILATSGIDVTTLGNAPQPRLPDLLAPTDATAPAQR